MGRRGRKRTRGQRIAREAKARQAAREGRVVPPPPAADQPSARPRFDANARQLPVLALTEALLERMESPRAYRPCPHLTARPRSTWASAAATVWPIDEPNRLVCVSCAETLAAPAGCSVCGDAGRLIRATQATPADGPTVQAWLCQTCYRRTPTAAVPVAVPPLIAAVIRRIYAANVDHAQTCPHRVGLTYWGPHQPRRLVCALCFAATWAPGLCIVCSTRRMPRPVPLRLDGVTAVANVCASCLPGPGGGAA